MPSSKPATPPDSPWISAEEAATLLGVKRASLYSYVSRGLLRAQRLPKQTTLLELKQNGAWKLVQVLEQTGNPVTGFVHQSQVSLMEDEQ